MNAAWLEAQAEATRANVTSALVSKDANDPRRIWIFYGIVAISGFLLYKGYQVVAEKRTARDRKGSE
jgi:hypothetical protein